MPKDAIAEFWSNGKNLQEEGVFNAAYKQFIKQLRKTLDDSSKLAQSIDRNDILTIHCNLHNIVLDHCNLELSALYTS